MKRRAILFAAGVSLLLAMTTASAVPIRITITSNAPANGVSLTPMWVGFHNGSFDSYDGGAPAAPALERLAEDGNAGPISTVFGANGTLVTTGVAQVGTRVQGSIGGLIVPGGSVSSIFDLATDGSNGFFSYASMVLPSNDYFVANGSPTAHDLTGVLISDAVLSFNIGNAGTVNDAGTEVNDFNTSAGNGLVAGLPAGQGGADQGADENGVITNIANPFANFANSPGLAALAALNFNNTSLYPNGIATITIERIDTDPGVPEPGVMLLLAAGAFGFLPAARRRKAHRVLPPRA